MIRRRWTISLAVALALPCLVRGEEADRKRRDPDAELAGWTYPKSECTSAGARAAGSPAGLVASMTTDDPIEDVIAFYEKKVGQELTVQVSSWFNKTATEPERLLQVEGQGRPLRIRLYEENSPAHSLLLVISRGEGDRQTHIDWNFIAY